MYWMLPKKKVKQMLAQIKARKSCVTATLDLLSLKYFDSISGSLIILHITLYAHAHTCILDWSYNSVLFAK